MSLFDENPSEPQREPDDSTETAPTAHQTSESAQTEPDLALAGDPITYVAVHPEAAHPPGESVPEDLRISWSWLHLLLFGIFGIISLLVVQLAFAIYYVLETVFCCRQYGRLGGVAPLFFVRNRCVAS